MNHVVSYCQKIDNSLELKYSQIPELKRGKYKKIVMNIIDSSEVEELARMNWEQIEEIVAEALGIKENILLGIS